VSLLVVIMAALAAVAYLLVVRDGDAGGSAAGVSSARFAE
jgi:hypothetical protein